LMINQVPQPFYTKRYKIYPFMSLLHAAERDSVRCMQGYGGKTIGPG
jgi:hypothetical protein